MPYPASVDANVIAPWTLVSPLLGATYAYGSSHIITTDRIYLHSVWLPAGATVVHMRVPHGGTSAGNLDMGIYDFNGNLLDRTGIIAAGSAFSTQDAPLSNGNLYLPAGRYYLALWADNQTDTYYQLPNIGSDIPGFGNLLTSVNASVSGLQANFAAMGGTSQNNCCYIAMLATLQGSTSWRIHAIVFMSPMQVKQRKREQNIMMDAAELLFLGKYAGGQIAPIGTFVDFRTLDYYQQASDGALPADGTYIFISQTSGLSATQIATAVNAVLNTSYVAGSFHARGSSDAATSQGTGADDA